MTDILRYTYLNNSLQDYLLFLAAIIVGFLAVRLAERCLLRRLREHSKRTKGTIDDRLVRGIEKYLLPIAYFAVFYLATKILYLETTITKLVGAVTVAFTTIMGTMFVSSVTVFILERYWFGRTNGGNRLVQKWVSGLLKTLIWVIAFILFLDNIGVQINSLLAGLGIGGIAVAFAAQAVLEDFLCFFSIILDRPFEIGDFITTGDQSGTVEHIGLKTTRLRSLSGEQLVFSNRDLTNSRIRNYKTLERRRVLFTIGVTYNTPSEKLREIPELIKSIIESIPETVFGRAHFATYGDYSLKFEVAYYVLSSDYDKYMNIQQQVNLRIKEEFDQRGIEFALPTQAVLFGNGQVAQMSDGKSP